MNHICYNCPRIPPLILRVKSVDSIIFRPWTTIATRASAYQRGNRLRFAGDFGGFFHRSIGSNRNPRPASCWPPRPWSGAADCPAFCRAQQALVEIVRDSAAQRRTESFLETSFWCAIRAKLTAQRRPGWRQARKPNPCSMADSSLGGGEVRSDSASPSRARNFSTSRNLSSACCRAPPSAWKRWGHARPALLGQPLPPTPPSIRRDADPVVRENSFAHRDRGAPVAYGCKRRKPASITRKRSPMARTRLPALPT